MQTTTKKEVSCRAFDIIFNSMKIKNIDENLILNGIPYDINYLKNKRERVEWFVWCKAISNLRPCFSPSEFEQMGADFVKRGGYIEGKLWAFFLFTSNKFSRVLNKQIFKIADSMFSCIKNRTDYLDKNKLQIIGEIEEGYEFCPEFFLIAKGVWQQLALQINQREFKVDLKMTSRKAIFDVSWKKEGYIYKVKRGIRWLFSIRKAMAELVDSHQTLLSHYEKLEQSKKLLQKQTTQLKTAHEISTSIRQSINIEDTLKAIADSLVSEAGFTYVSIQLYKDIDENNIDIKIKVGTKIKSVSPIQQEIIISEKKIGELIIHPNLEMDYRDVNELVDYLKPVINIAIHDALILRTITDYKDNLEQKVANRTFELQKARDELSNTNELLKESQQAQSRFFTNISHEFRTPLTLILGPAKRIIERSKDSGTKADADFIHRSAKKLNRLVDELLDISKIEAGEMKIKAYPMNLVSIVNEIALSFHSLAERKNITFKLNSGEQDITAYVDKGKVDKILTNLLSNAFKFTPELGKVDLGIKRNEKFAVISISDTGIGIPQNQIDKIFDKFYQVDGGHTREQEGTGIGLSLTKELVELHKGKIEVESEEGKGSTFRLIFPLGKEHLRPDEICEKEIMKDFRKVKEASFAEFEEPVEIIREQLIEDRLSEKPTLLIVEDNPDVRKYINMILESQYKIFEAKDGEEGLNKSFECIPDLIISDIMMPKLDGFQLCSKLKTDSRTSHIPIIMLTAKATMQDKISGLELGADEYIMKPFEAEELKARIKNLLEQRRRLHEHFRQYGLIELDKENITSVDQRFLQKAVAVINEHISDSSFGVEMMADDMAVSSSLLFKKIKSLIGVSPSELIKRIRLNKAAKLIEKKTGNISKIALEVGFNNPSYFAECFRKQFGIAPTQYHLKPNNT